MNKRTQDPRASLRRPRAAKRERSSTPLERRVRAFLAGESDGGDLLEALYSDVLDEPVPERLLAPLRR